MRGYDQLKDSGLNGVGESLCWGSISCPEGELGGELGPLLLPSGSRYARIAYLKLFTMHQRALSFSSRQGFVNNFILLLFPVMGFEQPHESDAHSLDEYGAFSSAAAC